MSETNIEPYEFIEEPKARFRWLSPFSIGLALLSLYAAFNSLYNLAGGARSEYYAAIARSMSLSFSNWFFGSFDPAGSVTLDKIPGSYWVPAIFVKIFGFSTWAVDAPNALAVIAAVIITVFAVRRIGGNSAGLIAGFVVATTPVLTAVSRANQPQSYFILALALALWAAIKALQTGERKHLIVAGLFVALGFNFYMLEAWAVWPALIIGWLALSPKQFEGKSLVKKLVDLLIAGSISLGASIIWPTIVWLVPAADRPFIGGTYHNNPFEMIFGYNGLGRFGATASDAGSSYQTFTPPFAGEASILRLFNDQLVGQIGWLLPTAIIAAVVLWFTKTNRAVVLALTVWFLSFAVMFSAVAGMHQFYTSALAIPVAALIGLALAECQKVGLKWGQIAIVTSASSTAFYIAGKFWSYFGWVSFVQGVIALAAIGLMLVKLQKFKWMSLALTTVALLLTPAVWASDAMNHPSTINPVAGEQSAMGFGGPGGGFGGPGAGFGGPGAGLGGSGTGNNGQGMPNFGGTAGEGMPNFGGTNGQNGHPDFGPNGHPDFGGNGHPDFGPNGHPDFGGKGFPGFGGQGGQGSFGPGAGTGQGANAGAGAGAGAGFGQGAGGAGFDPLGSINQDLVAFLKTNAAGLKYQVAMFGGMSAAPYITQTDLSVLPVGGFNGSDPSPTLEQFQALVADGQLKYVLAGNGPMGMGGMNGGMAGSGSSPAATESTSSQIDTWVSTNCQTVNYASATKTATSSASTPSFFGTDQSPVLYSCKK